MEKDICVPKYKLHRVSEEGEVKFESVLGSFIGLNDNAYEGVEYSTYEVMKGLGLIGKHKAKITGKAKIHGIECIEVTSTYFHFSNQKELLNVCYCRKNEDKIQTVAIFEEYPDGFKVLYTMKDQFFIENHAVGENNCGMNIFHKSNNGVEVLANSIKCEDVRPGKYELIGEYELSIDNKVHKVFRLIYFAHENQFSDFFITNEGEEIMHRFYVPDNGYGNNRIGNPFSKEFPNAEVLYINNERVVLSTIEISERAYCL